MRIFGFNLGRSVRRPSRLTLGLLVLLVVVSCAGKDNTPGPISVTRDTVLPAPDLPRDLWTLDEEFADINRKVPGFAGYTVNSKGVTEVALVNTNDLEAATRVLIGTFGTSGFNARQTIEAKPVSYEFNQLAVWREQALRALNLDGVAEIDINEAENKVVIGFLREAGLRAARAKQASRGFGFIPPDALQLEVAGDVTLDVGFPTESTFKAMNDGRNIHDPVVPRVGGLALRVPYGTGALCTLSFNGNLIVNGVSQRGFVTNSHCSDNMFDPDVLDNVYRQPYDGVLIGREILDPEPFRYGDCTYTALNPKYSCRRRDATFIKYLSTVTSRRQIAEANSVFDITKLSGVRRVEKTFIGKPAFKSGAKTGRTIGSVVATCVGRRTSEPNTWFLCQDKADYGRAGGDSGSPVYNESPSILLGIHWGADENGVAFFSPFINIARDLGVSLAILE